tara:strand:+ start:1635 stop:2300 length:666 start_codon:yes stop_codon:yes gene_type:complete
MNKTINEQKLEVAKTAIQHIPIGSIVGVGTGSTANYFIDELAKVKNKINGAVASSDDTAQRLKSHHIEVLDLNNVSDIPVYVDGADEITEHLHMIKGGGGALTREKIVAAAAKKFICITDESKLVNVLGEFPLPIEVIPMARSYVAREIVQLGGNPVLREKFITDNGNIILDIHNLKIINPIELEVTLNQITGIVTNGLFAKRSANMLLLGTNNGVRTITI